MRRYDSAKMLLDGSKEIREEGNNVLIPQELFRSATPFGVGDCIIYHILEMKDGTKVAATQLIQ